MAMPAGSRNLACADGPSAKPGVPASPASVETVVEEEPGGVTGTTLKPSISSSISSRVSPTIVVDTRTVLGARDAVGEIVNCAVAVNESTTVTGPRSPEAAPPTDTSPPNVARVRLAAQRVLLP